MSTVRACVCAVLAVGLAGCGSNPDVGQLGQNALDAMGGADAVRSVQSYQLRGGSGERSRLGQRITADQDDPRAKLANVVETVDLANERVALDYEVQTASGFGQHRQEILTKRGNDVVGLENVAGRPLTVVSGSGLFSWGTQNHPAMALKRNVIAVARAAADTSGGTLEDKSLDGRTYRFGTVSMDGEDVGVYFDPETNLIAAFETTDTETMLGDVPALYVFDDYRDVSGVRLPHRITVQKGGEHYADVQYSSASINDAAALGVFDIPAEAEADVAAAIAAGPDYSPVTLTRIADGVHFAQAYSHHSLIVEFPTFLAVVEAPYTEAQSLTLGRVLNEQFPDKPIRYAVATHPHFDHIGGIRGIAAQGATIIGARGHESQLSAVLDAPHTNPPDRLAARRNEGASTGSLEVFDERHVISEGKRSLELYAITGNPHVDPMVIAFVPGPGVLFQSDLYFPGTGGGTSPAAEHLLQSVRALKLRVQRHAGGHGGVADFSELVKAVGRTE
jgi:glyoxylase-like metal-dependent hydrolase (beta-lactamase superfamily II)